MDESPPVDGSSSSFTCACRFLGMLVFVTATGDKRRRVPNVRKVGGFNNYKLHRFKFIFMYIYINNSASSKERELRSLGHSAMEDGKSGRRMRTLSVSILPGARLRRRSADTSATTRVAEDDSNIKKLQELLQQSLRREADTLKKLRHLSEMYQELLYRSHSPSTESKWNCADRCEYFQPLQVFFPRIAFMLLVS